MTIDDCHFRISASPLFRPVAGLNIQEKLLLDGLYHIHAIEEVPSNMQLLSQLHDSIKFPPAVFAERSAMKVTALYDTKNLNLD